MTAIVDTLLSFAPKFAAETGQIAQVAAGDRVSIQVGFSASASQTLVDGQLDVRVGDKVSEASNLTVTLTRSVSGMIQTTPLDYTRNTTDQMLTWNTLIKSGDIATVVFTDTPSFVKVSLLNGSLPPGLSINARGQISGTVSPINQATVYTFTLRLACDGTVRDRVFSIRAEHTESVSAFAPGMVQPLERDPSTGLLYKNLGKLDRGQGYAFSLDIQNPDQVVSPIRVRKLTGFPPGSNQFGGLPVNLAVVNQVVQGVISEDCCPGRYYFAIDVLDAGNATANFMIEITSNVTGKLGVIPQVIWDTPTGSIGEIIETEPSHLEVRAHTLAIDAPVVYTLAPYTSTFPPGLYLHPNNGRIYGRMPYVESDVTYVFAIRATAGNIFKERVFSIKVKNWFDINSVHQVNLKLRVTEAADLSPLYGDCIPADLLYRPEDENFGLVKVPYVYVMKGLDGTKDIEDALRGDPGVLTNKGTLEEVQAGLPVNPRINRDFPHDFRMLLAGHTFAVARDSSGNVVYEVLFRDLYDPMQKAGGFFVQNGIPVQKLVRWPESGIQPRFIYPVSLSNMRNDLIEDVGLAMSTATARQTLGSGSSELLPLWMRSEQIAGAASSIPGFTPSLLIAYLKPGSIDTVARAIVKALPYVTSRAQDGRVLHFDKFYTTETAVVEESEFDNQTTPPGAETNFDSIDFDVVDGDVVKYLD